MFQGIPKPQDAAARAILDKYTPEPQETVVHEMTPGNTATQLYPKAGQVPAPQQEPMKVGSGGAIKTLKNAQATTDAAVMEGLGHLDDARQGAEAAAVQGVKAQQAAIDADTQSAWARLAEHNQAYEAMAADIQQKQAVADAVEQDYQAAADAVRADMGEQVDPMRVFSKENGTRALAIFSVVMGTLHKNGGNFIGMLMQLMNKDVQAQREAFKRNQDERSYYGRLLKESNGDVDLAESKLRHVQMDILKEQATINAQSARNEEVKANAMGAISALEQEQAKLKNDTMTRYAQMQASSAAQEAGVRSDMAGRRLQANLAQQSATQAGRAVTAATAKEVGDLRGAEEMLADLEQNYADNASDFYSALTQYFPHHTRAKDYNDLRASAAQMIGGVMEGGKLADADYGRYYDMLPAPDDSDERAKSKIDNLRRLLRTKRVAGVESLVNAGYDASRL